MGLPQVEVGTCIYQENGIYRDIYRNKSIIYISAGSIFDISKYRDTCESSISIFSGIAIL